MRSSVLFAGSLLALVSIVACSSDSSGPKASPSQADAGDAAEDASSSADPDGGPGSETTDAGDDGATDGAVVEKPEQVSVRFGGTSYKLKTIVTAEVGADDVVEISANEGVDGGAAIDLFFDAATGTVTCAAGSHAKVTFNDGFAAYDAFETTGVCSISVTRVGDVGDAIDGTFTATVQNGSSTLQGNGSFHVLRKQ